jgi:hypothetical protein
MATSLSSRCHIEHVARHDLGHDGAHVDTTAPTTLNGRSSTTVVSARPCPS